MFEITTKDPKMIRVGPKTGYRNDALPHQISAAAHSPTVGGKQGALRRRPVGYLSVFAVAGPAGDDCSWRCTGTGARIQHDPSGRTVAQGS